MRTSRFVILFMLLAVGLYFPFGSALSQADNILWVTNTDDSGPGSLREVITNAKAGDTIQFSADVFQKDPLATIMIQTPLPELSQGGISIDAAPNGAILDGSAIDFDVCGFSIRSNGNTVKGLWIVHFAGCGIEIVNGASGNIIGGAAAGEGNTIGNNGRDGIRIFGEGTNNNTILGNNIGMDPTRKIQMPNGLHGVEIQNGAAGNVIGGEFRSSANVISANGSAGILLVNALDTTIQGNVIGMDRGMTTAAPNTTVGIGIIGSTNTLVGSEDKHFGNWIVGHGAIDVSRMSSGTVIAGNQIGLSSINIDRANGINIHEGSYDNIVGPGNTITNWKVAIEVSEPDTLRNRITQNILFGITDQLIKVGIPSYNAPSVVVTTITPRTLTGTTMPNAVIEVYSDPADQCEYYEGSTVADADGNFTVLAKFGDFKYNNIRALAADPDGTSGNLSEPVTKPEYEIIQPLPSLPSPSQVSADPEVVGTNLAIAFFAVIFFELTSSVANSAIKKIQFRFSEHLGKIMRIRWVKAIKGLAKADLIGTWKSKILFLGLWILIILINSSVESFLDPELRWFDESRLKTIGGLLLAGLVISGIEWGTGMIFHKRAGKQPNIRAELRSFGFLIALTSTVFSRSMQFTPGYLLGSLGTIALFPRINDKAGSGKKVLFVLGSILISTFILWMVSDLLPVGLVWLQVVFVSLFAKAIAGIAFELIPIQIFEGSSLWDWNKWVWALLFLPTSFMFVHLFLNPDAKSVKALNQNGIVTLLVMMGVYLVAALVLWIFANRSKEEL